MQHFDCLNLHMKLIYTTLLLITCIACSKQKDTNTTTFARNIKVKITEQIDSTGRYITLNCATIEELSCANIGILRTYSIVGNKITVHLTQLTQPTICLTAIAPASCTIPLGMLANKQYTLELNVGNVLVTGTLDVSNNSIVTSLPTQAKVLVINPTLNRIPSFTIYGYIHYHTPNTVPIVQSFIDSLLQYGATPIQYIPGNYEHFSIDNNGQVVQAQYLGYNYTRSYVYQYTAPLTTLKGLVRRYGISYGSSVLISLNSSQGITYNSWMP